METGGLSAVNYMDLVSYPNSYGTSTLLAQDGPHGTANAVKLLGGANSYFSMFDTGLIPDLGRSFTFSMWFKNAAVLTDEKVLFSLDNGVGKFILKITTTKNLYLDINGSVDQSPDVVSAGPNTWHQVAVIVNAETGRAILRYDGMELVRFTYIPNSGTSVMRGTVGAVYNSGTYSSNSVMLFSMPTLWDRAIDDCEADSLYFDSIDGRTTKAERGGKIGFLRDLISVTTIGTSGPATSNVNSGVLTINIPTPSPGITGVTSGVNSGIVVTGGSVKTLSLSTNAYKVLVHSGDTDPNFLDQKLTFLSPLLSNVTNPSGASDIVISLDVAALAANPALSNVNGKIAVSGVDTTKNYLFQKLTHDAQLSLAKVNPGGDEKVRISMPGYNTATTGSYGGIAALTTTGQLKASGNDTNAALKPLSTTVVPWNDAAASLSTCLGRVVTATTSTVKQTYVLTALPATTQGNWTLVRTVIAANDPKMLPAIGSPGNVLQVQSGSPDYFDAAVLNPFNPATLSIGGSANGTLMMSNGTAWSGVGSGAANKSILYWNVNTWAHGSLDTVAVGSTLRTDATAALTRVIDPTDSADLGAGGASALETLRRNAGNTAWEPVSADGLMVGSTLRSDVDTLQTAATVHMYSATYTGNDSGSGATLYPIHATSVTNVNFGSDTSFGGDFGLTIPVTGYYDVSLTCHGTAGGAVGTTTVDAKLTSGTSGSQTSFIEDSGFAVGTTAVHTFITLQVIKYFTAGTVLSASSVGSHLSSAQTGTFSIRRVG